jgi:hypothetical protein
MAARLWLNTEKNVLVDIAHQTRQMREAPTLERLWSEWTMVASADALHASPNVQQSIRKYGQSIGI